MPLCASQSGLVYVAVTKIPLVIRTDHIPSLENKWGWGFCALCLLGSGTRLPLDTSFKKVTQADSCLLASERPLTFSHGIDKTTY